MVDWLIDYTITYLISMSALTITNLEKKEENDGIFYNLIYYCRLLFIKNVSSNILLSILYHNRFC
jgi:hypothetical protein